MFESLSRSFSKIVQNVNGRRLLTENNIKDVLSEVRIALLEADVSLPVINNFIDIVRKKSFGHIVRKGLTPAQEFIKIVHSALVEVMGVHDTSLNLSVVPPAVILIVGFQGSGKTTTSAKLAKYLRIKKKKKVLLSSVDIYRPSGIEQLKILSTLAGVNFFRVENTNKKMFDIVSNAFLQAKLGVYDVLIVDTPGCLSTDMSIISEIVAISSFFTPVEILFIADAMLGQESASTASFLSSKVSFSGIILTKIDGDSRGGAAFSIYHVMNKPIKFIGTGEKIDDLELFHVSRIVDRILGMGDVLSLVEDIESKVDNIFLKDTLSKLNKGDVFDLSDFLNYLKQMRNMGGVGRILDRLPVMNKLTDIVKSKINDHVLIMMEVVINSMTIEERKYPSIIQNSRKLRIANGAGVSVQEISALLKRFEEVKSIMEKVNRNGLSKILNVLQSKLSTGFFQK